MFDLRRKRSGPLGFNIPYEFNTSDLSACTAYLQNHLSYVETRKRPVDWDCLCYMICDVQYGGRITDDFDRTCFMAYTTAWMNASILDARGADMRRLCRVQRHICHREGGSALLRTRFS